MIDTQLLTNTTGTRTLTVIDHEDGAPTPPIFSDGRVIRPHAGDQLPSIDDIDGLIVLGAAYTAYDDQAAPWLPDIRALLAAAVGGGVPTLALGLGAQLLAVATGGVVDVAAPHGPEMGIIQLRLRPDAWADPVFGAVATVLGRDFPVAQMHADAITSLPAGATWLASSTMYPYQAFRVGSALGLQFHPGASEELVLHWGQVHGLESEALRAGFAELSESLTILGQELTAAFVRQVNER